MLNIIIRLTERFRSFRLRFLVQSLAWLLRREIQTVHEYQADENTIKSGIDVKLYQLLLIRKSAGEYTLHWQTIFWQRNLHKRIH
jgi:hypothetical protein